ncbi:Kelch repeat-containing protein [Flavilitoribacter nigricans]|uniref:Galactose oxidase n=1 Tax=Flavilitoribacter nigricans (strain ATCC 23147 / DSM 23189 / NBRC 102662 / NCIMB 1420 / SS-2) TaxID=1122177 RepID=A0A2D0MXM3_FLAN2|nr:hypothetical protein [Flavilitoribacter nigricans]PHN00888.1 hypothetical protein CRP01_39810 [Flavilitoribacter nigricans DSM 23189 = NBRC 102662]
MNHNQLFTIPQSGSSRGKTRPIWLFLLFGFVFFACEPWELEQQDYIQIELEPIETISIDSVRITGLIGDLSIGPITAHGILWSTNAIIPSFFEHDGKHAFGGKTIDQNPQFSAIIKLAPNTEYIFRGYATTDGKNYVYSDPVAYISGNATITTLGIDYEKEYSLEISGKLTGTEKDLTAVKHGFCWSNKTELPTLFDQFVNLGTRLTNDPFFYTLEGLENEEDLFIRAYAILQYADLRADTIYGNTLQFDGDLNFWSKVADFPGALSFLGNALTFSIGDKGYLKPQFRVFDGDLRSDFWEYDPETDAWTQKANFSGPPRSGATASATDRYGYVGLGSDETRSLLQDFWQYDPMDDSWEQKADFAGGPTENAIGFAIDGKCYWGVGRKVNPDYSKELTATLWEYDPAGDEWTQKEDFPGPLRVGGIHFSTATNGYFGLGGGSFTTSLDDFWEYAPTNNTWTRKADFVAGPRRNAAALSINDKGYVGLGETDAREIDFWEYDPMTNAWNPRADFIGEKRVIITPAATFSIAGKGYLGLGFNFSTVNFANELKDFWVFDP